MIQVLGMCKKSTAIGSVLATAAVINILATSTCIWLLYTIAPVTIIIAQLWSLRVLQFYSRYPSKNSFLFEHKTRSKYNTALRKEQFPQCRKKGLMAEWDACFALVHVS